MEQEGLLTIEEVMKFMKISRSTVDRLMKTGILPYVKLSPRLIRFRKRDIEELINRFRIGGEGD